MNSWYSAFVVYDGIGQFELGLIVKFFQNFNFNIECFDLLF